MREYLEESNLINVLVYKTNLINWIDVDKEIKQKGLTKSGDKNTLKKYFNAFKRNS